MKNYPLLPYTERRLIFSTTGVDADCVMLLVGRAGLTQLAMTTICNDPCYASQIIPASISQA